MSLRREALPKLQSILNQDLHRVAEDLGTLPPQRDIKQNKGWVGQTLERFLELDPKNLPKPDGVDYELKSTSLVFAEGSWAPKETIKITSLNPQKILTQTFETSTLWEKLNRWIFVGVFHESTSICKVVKVAAIDLNDPHLVLEVKTFWEEVQTLVIRGEIKDYVNFGNSEGLIQLRPTGDGKTFSRCPITGDRFPSRAFYATKKLISRLLN